MDTVFPFGFDSSITFYLSLYVLTWVLHVVFMAYVLAGSLYVAWATVFPGSAESPRPDRPVCTILREWIPFMLSGAITVGVAPLLFVQIAYRQQFYTANLLLGWRWLVVIPVLIVAFYLLYLLKSRAIMQWSPLARRLTAVVVAGSFLFVAFCWTTNHLLGLEQHNWAESFGTGTVVWSTTALTCRLVTWICTTFPVMWLIVQWQLKGTSTIGVRPAIAGLVLATLGAIAYGYLLPEDIRNELLGAAGQAWLVTAAIGIVIQLAGWTGLRAEKSTTKQLTVVSVGCILWLMGIGSLREIIRVAQIDGPQLLENCQAAANVGGFALFVGTLALNGVLIALCLFATIRSRGNS